MPLSPEQREFLSKALSLTKDKEMDCDEFANSIAMFFDAASNARVSGEEWTGLFEHHRQICPECEEELQLVAKALTLVPPPTPDLL